MIINQNAHQPTLPQFRNMGVLLRLLLWVHGLLLVSLCIRYESGQNWLLALQDLALYSEPIVLFSLFGLYWLHPWFCRQAHWLALLVAQLLPALAALLWLSYLSYLWASPIPHLVWSKTIGFTWLGTVLSLSYFHLRERALSPALTEARLQALQARIHPHFLFNTLNAVLNLIRRDPSRAEHALEDLADLIRAAMSDARRLSTLGQEIALAKQYLALEALRMGERMEVEWVQGQVQAHTPVPPLLLQPLLENAVRHGIEPSTTPGRIRINLYRKHGQLHIVVHNTREPHAPSRPGNQIALPNIVERLELYYDAEASLNTRQGADYYQVHVIIPLQGDNP